MYGYESNPQYRPHTLRRALTALVSVAGLSFGGGAVAYYEQHQAASDDADTAVTQAQAAFKRLAAAPESQKLSSAVEINSRTHLLFNSIGAWLVSSSTDVTDAYPMLRITKSRSIVMFPISVTAEAPLQPSDVIPAGTATITQVAPIIYDATCVNGDMHAAKVIVPSAPLAYEIDQVVFADQCSTDNGLKGNQVSIHGEDYLQRQPTR